MKSFVRTLSYFLLALTTLACSETKLLQKGLSPFIEPLGYDFTSPIVKGPKTDSLVILFNGLPLDSLTTVKRHKTTILPFVFFNYFDNQYQISLGRNSLKDDFNDFFFNSLMDESDRSGQFALSYDSVSTDSTYRLEVRIDTCETTCVFQKQQIIIYYVYGYGITYTERVKPSHCKISGTAVLRKGNRLLFDKTFTSNKELAFPGGENMYRSEMYPILSWNLAESLCQCTKDCISTLVRETNKAIAQ